MTPMAPVFLPWSSPDRPISQVLSLNRVQRSNVGLGPEPSSQRLVHPKVFRPHLAQEPVMGSPVKEAVPVLNRRNKVDCRRTTHRRTAVEPANENPAVV